MAAVIDPAGDSLKRFTPWMHAVSRMVGFEFSAALAAEGRDPYSTKLIRSQHQQIGDVLLWLIGPGRN